jgi:hypothetical protein
MWKELAVVLSKHCASMSGGSEKNHGILKKNNPEYCKNI